MKHSFKVLCIALTFLAFNNPVKAQFSPPDGCIVDANGECIPNTILGALPFLRIIPDAASGAMGDAGIATNNGYNALHFNGSKLPFAEEDSGLSFTYTPWLRNLGLNDVYMAYLSGYMKMDEFQSIGASLRFFSLGDINFTDIEGAPAGSGKPREWEAAIGYARKLSPNFSAGLTAKYMVSNLASGQIVQGIEISSATSFAADLSLTYDNDIVLGAYDGKLRVGLALTNIGSKVTYTNNPTRDFIPTNFGLGAALELNFDEYNSMTFALDINKLMIPTPIPSKIFDENGNIEDNPDYDREGDPAGGPDGVADYRQKSLFSGILGSWGDAQGGFSEELQEFNYSVGVEYWYDKQFAVRLGYYYEHPLKGARQFLTVGAGLKYNVFGFDISYLVPTNNVRNPLDNTLRFTLLFDFDVFRPDDL